MADKISFVVGNTTLDFNSNKYTALIGTSGHFMPPIEFVEEETPYQTATRLRNIKTKARDIDVPLLIRGSTTQDLRNNERALMRSLNPFVDGRLVIACDDGTVREVNCRYKSGFEGNESRDLSNAYLKKVVLVFRAFDPFFYDTNAIVQTFTSATPQNFFPIFPLRLSSSNIFANTNIDVAGDIDTDAIWTISDQADSITITNASTNKLLKLDIKLGVNESVTIDTKRGTVTKNDGTNLFYCLSDDSSFFKLQAGQNVLRIEVANATPSTSVTLSYKNRYWGV